MKTRVFAVLLVSVMTAVIFTGCAGEKDTGKPIEQAAEDGGEISETAEITPELTDNWYNVEKLFGQDDFTITFAGEVKNADKTHYWTYVPVVAKLLDADGNELKSSSEAISVLAPGETGAVVGVVSCETEPASVEIILDNSALSASTEAPADYIPSNKFEMSDIRIGEKEMGEGVTSMTGKIGNLSDKAAENVKFTILFKKDGKIAAASTDYAAFDLEAGATADIESIVNKADYDNYVIYLIATAAQ